MKVAAGVFINDKSVLLMRRDANQPLAGEWEFPGGKFEQGESGAECLRRELNEELGIDATIGEQITYVAHTTDSGRLIELYVYLVPEYIGQIQMRVHDMMEWVPLTDLVSHSQLPADVKISQCLVEKFG